MSSRRKGNPVNPVKTGVQYRRNLVIRSLCWTPAYDGVTGSLLESVE